MAATIRKMKIEDFASVYNLGLRCYHVEDKPYNYWSIREVADHLEGHPDLCFVADDNGQIAGFVLGADSYELLTNTGHLEWIAVAPEYRRQGLASQLMETMVKAYREMGKASIVTDISSENPASRSLAGRLGFREGISVTFFVKDLT